MARFSGIVGFGKLEQTRPGVWEDIITEKQYFGDVVRNTLQVRESTETVNDNLSLSHSIEIAADGYASEHVLEIKYVWWKGVPWEITSVEERRPRLILRLGDRYNGTTGASSTP